jgi:hypothetical protein
MDLQNLVSHLIERIERLEKRSRRRRRNQQEAAARLNMSVSKLRGLHQRGLGPKRSRNGRIWSYDDADIDAYAEHGDA